MRNRIVALAAAGTLAVLTLSLLPRSYYEPGALLEAHQQLSSDCIACHRPWRGPSDDGCVSCHGEISHSNPHSDFDVSETDTGLIAGHNLAVTAADGLGCLSCHGEHRGAVINIRQDAAFACTWCHKHPAISAVPEHRSPEMQRRFSVRHLFQRPFDHYEHKLLFETGKLPVGRRFICSSCHDVVPPEAGQVERMSFRWDGCTGAGCHIVPQDRFMELPPSMGAHPAMIVYSGIVPVRHINAVFIHSANHLQSRCEQCHIRIAASRNPDDADSLAIRRCFDCHAHQVNSSREQAQATQDRSHAIRSSVFPPGTMPPSTQRIVACGDCHLFHVYGVVPSRDFETRAPTFPPNHPRPSG
jgi:hypothetical protein